MTLWIVARGVLLALEIALALPLVYLLALAVGAPSAPFAQEFYNGKVALRARHPPVPLRYLCQRITKNC